MKYLQTHDSFIVSNDILKIEKEEEVPYILCQIGVKLSYDDLRKLNISQLNIDPDDKVDNDYVNFLCEELKGVEAVLVLAKPRSKKED